MRPRLSLKSCYIVVLSKNLIFSNPEGQNLINSFVFIYNLVCVESLKHSDFLFDWLALHHFVLSKFFVVVSAFGKPLSVDVGWWLPVRGCVKNLYPPGSYEGVAPTRACQRNYTRASTPVPSHSPKNELTALFFVGQDQSAASPCWGLLVDWNCEIIFAFLLRRVMAMVQPEVRFHGGCSSTDHDRW